MFDTEIGAYRLEWGFNGLPATHTATGNTKSITTIKEKMIKADLRAAIGKPVY